MQVIEHALQVLKALADHPDRAGVTQLNAQLSLPGSTIHRVLASLADYGRVWQEDGTRLYRIGPSLLRLGQAYERQASLIRVSSSHLQRLRDDLAESVFLTEFASDQAICVATVESPRSLQYFMRLGQRMPFRSAASARAILAFQPLDLARELMEREFTDGTPTVPTTVGTPPTVEAALALLETVRQEGVAFCDEAMEPNVTAISAPIRNAGGKVVGSITMVGPFSRMDASKRAEVAERVREAGAAVTADLGFMAPPKGNSLQANGCLP